MTHLIRFLCFLILALGLANPAAADVLHLPNLGTSATGTNVSGKKSMDVYVSGGALTFSEQATAADGAALPAASKVVAGSDGTATRTLKTNASGQLQVGVVSSSLPTGAATAANQTSANTSLSSIDSKITAVNTGAVVVSSSALPTGASTAAKQDSLQTSLDSLNAKVTAVNTGAVTVSSSALPSGAATAAKQPALGTAGASSADVITVQGIASMTALKVDGSAVTQPISASSLPLPTGAATSAAQTTANSSLSTIATNTGQSPINTTGSQTTASISAVTTLTAPASAVGFILQAADANTANLRYRIGSAATTTAGQQLQPGRDTGYIPVGANISIIPESGTQEYQVQWVQR